MRASRSFEFIVLSILVIRLGYKVLLLFYVLPFYPGTFINIEVRVKWDSSREEQNSAMSAILFCVLDSFSSIAHRRTGWRSRTAHQFVLTGNGIVQIHLGRM